MCEDFGHLFASSRPIAALSSEERLRRICADRWINYRGRSRRWRCSRT